MIKTTSYLWFEDHDSYLHSIRLCDDGVIIHLCKCVDDAQPFRHMHTAEKVKAMLEVFSQLEDQISIINVAKIEYLGEVI